MNTKAIIVLGMHRSGTSATAGVLHLLGAEVGSKLLKTQEHVNAEGFWENADVVSFHNHLFNTLNSGWWDISPVPATSLEPSLLQLENLLQQEFGHSQLWLVKDPRMCRFMPLWKAALTSLKIVPRYLIVLRHPQEVAESLIKRDGFSYPHALLLWLRYVLDSEKGSREQVRTVITYENLLADWRSTISHVATALEINLNLNDSDVASRIDNFIKPQLRHHMSTTGFTSSHLLSLAITAYESLQVGDIQTLDAISEKFDVEMERNFPWVKQVGGLMNRYAEIDALQAEIEALQAEIVRIKSTFSWRVTKPLRLLANTPKHITSRLHARKSQS